MRLRIVLNATTLVVTTWLTALLLGCASPYRIVQNQTDNAARWPEYRTFAFVDTASVSAVPPSYRRSVMDRVQQAVAAELTRQGYQPSADNPDLLVNLGLVIQEKVQTRQTNIREAPLYIGQRRYSWRSQEVPVGTYNEGTLNVHVVDAQRNALVWDAAVQSVLDRKSATPERINEAVAKLFSKFPGRKG